MRTLVLFAALAASTSIATADDHPASVAPQSTSVTRELPFPIALAVNTPIMWAGSTSIGISGYVAIREHQSLRLNFAKYEAMGAKNILNTLAGGDITHLERFTDVGASWQYYPRSVWNGLLLELGVLRRTFKTREYDDNRSIPVTIRANGAGYAGRAMIGWSWLGWDRVFVTAAVGASLGSYSGTETSSEDSAFTDPRVPAMTTTSDFDDLESSIEAYLRFGIAFGL